MIDVPVYIHSACIDCGAALETPSGLIIVVDEPPDSEGAASIVADVFSQMVCPNGCGMSCGISTGLFKKSKEDGTVREITALRYTYGYGSMN